MLDKILGAVLPMGVTFLLGFVAARRRDFGAKEASTLNQVVLVYAVPLALFAGTVTARRAESGQRRPASLICRHTPSSARPAETMQVADLMELLADVKASTGGSEIARQGPRQQRRETLP